MNTRRLEKEREHSGVICWQLLYIIPKSWISFGNPSRGTSLHETLKTKGLTNFGKVKHDCKPKYQHQTIGTWKSKCIIVQQNITPPHPTPTPHGVLVSHCCQHTIPTLTPSALGLVQSVNSSVSELLWPPASQDSNKLSVPPMSTQYQWYRKYKIVKQ